MLQIASCLYKKGNIWGFVGGHIWLEGQTTETRVSSVIEKLDASRLRETFHLLGNVSFENHANALTDESRIVADMSSAPNLNLPCRSKRLATKTAALTS